MACWVGSAFYGWDLPPHASRVALRVLSSISGENASAATIWWPLSGNTDAFHFKPVAMLQYIIVFSASKAQKPGKAGGVRPGLGVGPRSGQFW